MAAALSAGRRGREGPRGRSAGVAPSTLWVPGRGPDAAAVARMERAFPKPGRPMGEAWFMSPKRRMYPLLLGDLDAVDDGEIASALEQVATGTSSFGPHEEWTAWFHHLLPRLVARDRTLGSYSGLEVLFTAFMAQHPSGNGPWPYPEFRADALATLGRLAMAQHLWPGGRPDAAACLGKWETPSGLFGWYRAGGLLSASLFFCAKYLPAGDVPDWFGSVLAIGERRWTTQVLTWLVGAHAILAGETVWPSALSHADVFAVDWDWSHVLRGVLPGVVPPAGGPPPFLPAANRAAILRAARLFDAEAFFEDLLTDPELEVVAAEAAGLPERFADLYR